MSWIDSHCHLDFGDFSHPLDLIDKLKGAGCKRVMVPAICAQYFDRVLAFQKLKPEFIDLALGLHPYFMDQHSQSSLNKLSDYLQRHKPLAVGEMGLDKMLNPEGFEQQLTLFKAQLIIAKQHNLPIIVHSRKAHDEVAKCIKDTQFNGGGFIHGFSGSQQQAKRYLNAGFAMGLGGALTYERAKAMHKMVAYLPDDGYVLETDSPDMAPSFAKGGINTPLNIPRIAQHIADLRRQTLEDIYLNSNENYARVLRLPS